MYVSTLGGYTRTYIHRVPLCFLFFFSSFLSFSRFSFISFLRLILVSAGVRTRTRSDIRRRLIPRDTRDFFAFPPAKVDFPFRVPGDVDAANKSPSSTFKRRLSSYALSHPFSSWKYLIFPLRILSLSLSLAILNLTVEHGFIALRASDFVTVHFRVSFSLEKRFQQLRESLRGFAKSQRAIETSPCVSNFVTENITFLFIESKSSFPAFFFNNLGYRRNVPWN